MKVQNQYRTVVIMLLAFAMAFFTQVACVSAADDIVTVRFNKAKAYEAPGHFKMEAYGLQGKRFNTPAAVSIGMSVFHPGGGTEKQVNSRSGQYMVAEGEITITLDEGDIVLGQYDAIYLPGGLKRGIMNNGKTDAKMLVMSPSDPSSKAIEADAPIVVRFKNATSYNAPGHFKMDAYGLQGSRFKSPAEVNLSLSVFHPEGGTDIGNNSQASLYMVAEGELTIKRPEGNIVLNQYDSVYIPGGVSRGILNDSGKDVKMLVFSSAVSGAGAATKAAKNAAPFVGDDVLKAKQIFGNWEATFQGGKAVMAFNEDGSLAMAQSVKDLKTSPLYTGWYWFEKDMLHFSEAMCSSVGLYKVKLQDGKAIALQVVEDECGEGRITDLTAGMNRIGK